MIWASASCTLIILPNSVGCLALPRRMTSVVGSKRLTIFPSACVSPRSTRARVCWITCLTRGAMLSSSFWIPSNAACCSTSAERFTPSAMSLTKRCACPTTATVDVSSFWYKPFIRSCPCWPLPRLARAISTTRNFTRRVRSRSFVPTSPATSVGLFIKRVSTRTPSPNKLLSVG